MSETAESPVGKWGIAANIVEDSALRDGAKVIILSWGQGHPVVTGRSFHGRRIEKRVNQGKLFHFRPVFLLPGRDGGYLTFDTKAEAQECCPGEEDSVNP